MDLSIEECSDDDMLRTFEVISAAFCHEHPYIEAVFPSHDSSMGRVSGGERMLAIKRTDPHTVFIKAVDKATGLMIGQAKWNIYDGVVPAEVDLEGNFWDTADEKEFAQHLHREYLVPRRTAVRELGGKVISLDILTVDPEYQKRGAGRLLVRWGTALADKTGVETVVEASEYGLELYRSEGFEVKRRYEICLPEKWAERDTQRFIWMVRPAKKIDQEAQC